MAVVETSKGKVSGFEKNGCAVYLNVPYAAPPVGERRFRRAVPHEGWAGVRAGGKKAWEIAQAPLPAALRAVLSPGGSSKRGENGLPGGMTEEALNVHVATPLAPSRQARAVMVWIHGGGFENGCGYSPVYESSLLAASQDVVVVAVNYRLGNLGFLYKPDCGFESNLGLHDQVAALRWVQAEVSRFGGDPARVTVFGESAGAMSICQLLASPLAAGLFRGAICQSGAACQTLSVAAAASTADLFAEALGVPPAELSAERLRGMPVRTLVEAEAKVKAKTKLMLPFAPVEAEHFPYPLRAIGGGAGAGVALLSGTLPDEYKLFLMGMPGKFSAERTQKAVARRLGDTLPPYVRDGVPSKAEAIVQGAERELQVQGAKAKDVYGRVMGDYLFTVPHERLVDAHRGPAYSYRIDWASPIRALGACHAVELPLLFGTHRHPQIALFAGKGPEADAFSELLMGVWGAFARGLVPGTSATGEWPQHDSVTRPTMVLGARNKAAADLRYGLRTQELSAWTGVYKAKL